MENQQNEPAEIAAGDGKKAVTIESLMRDRVSDPRALIGALVIDGDRVFLMFGDVASHPRVTVQIIGNEFDLIAPREILGEIGADENPGEGEKAKKDIDPQAHTKDELLEMGAAAGIEMPASATKAEIAAALNSAK